MCALSLSCTHGEEHTWATRTVANVGNQVVPGPGNQVVTGPGNQVVPGPGNQIIAGPGNQIIAGPRNQAVTGLEIQVVPDPGNLIVTWPRNQGQGCNKANLFLLEKQLRVARRAVSIVTVLVVPCRCHPCRHKPWGCGSAGFTLLSVTLLYCALC